MTYQIELGNVLLNRTRKKYLLEVSFISLGSREKKSAELISCKNCSSSLTFSLPSQEKIGYFHPSIYPLPRKRFRPSVHPSIPPLSV